MQLLIIVATLLGLLSVTFALQNNVPVTVTLLLWRFDSSLAVVLLLAFALGALVVGLASTPSTVRRQWASRRQQKRIHQLETQQALLEAQLGELQRQLQRQLQDRQDQQPGQSPGEPAAPAAASPYVGLSRIFSGRPSKP